MLKFELASRWAINEIILNIAQAEEFAFFTDVANKPGLRKSITDLMLQLHEHGVQPSHFQGWDQSDPRSQDLFRIWQRFQQIISRFGQDDLRSPGTTLNLENVDWIGNHHRRAIRSCLEHGGNVKLRWAYAREMVESLNGLSAQQRWLDDQNNRFGNRISVSYEDSPDSPSAQSLRAARQSFMGCGSSNTKSDGSVCFIEASTPLLEVDQISCAIRQALDSGPELRPNQIAIVARDVEAYRALVLERLPRVGLRVQEASGPLLGETLMFRYVMQLLSLPINQFGGRSLLGVVQSSYCPVGLLERCQLDPFGLEQAFREWRFRDESQMPLEKLQETHVARLRLERGMPAEGLEQERSKGVAILGAVEAFLGPIRAISSGPIDSAALQGFIRDHCAFGDNKQDVSSERSALESIHQAIVDIDSAWEMLDRERSQPLDTWIAALLDCSHLINVSSTPFEGGAVQFLTPGNLPGKQFHCIFAVGAHDAWGVGLDAQGRPHRHPPASVFPSGLRRVLNRSLWHDGLSPLPDSESAPIREEAYLAQILQSVTGRLTLSVPITAESQTERVPGNVYATFRRLLSPEKSSILSSRTTRELVPRLTQCCNEDDMFTRVALARSLPVEQLAELYSDSDGTEQLAGEEKEQAAGLHETLARQEPEKVKRIERAVEVEKSRWAAQRNNDTNRFNGNFGSEFRSTLFSRLFAGEQDVAIRGSKMEQFSKCPFQYLSEDILELEPLGLPPEGMLRTERGTLVHNILEVFCANLPTEKDMEIWKTKLMEVADGMIAAWQEAGLFGPPELFQRENTAIRNVLEKFVDVELNSSSEEGWRPTLMEYYLQGTPLPSAYPTTERVGNKIFGRVDRIDINTTDGSCRVVDYKDSRRKYDKKDFALGTSLQVALYALALEQEDEVKLASAGWPDGIRPGNWAGAYYTLGRPPGEVIQKVILLEEDDWRETVAHHVDHFADAAQLGRFPVYPTEKACEWCPMNSLCRVHQESAQRTGNVWEGDA